jgi:hypothetical protein
MGAASVAPAESILMQCLRRALGKVRSGAVSPEALRHARALALHFGLAIVPLIHGTKQPLIRWKDRPALPPSAEEIARWWRDDPSADVGLILGDRLCALDVDEHGEAHGLDSLDELERMFGPLPETWRALTPSGGLHVYFALAGEVSSTTHEIAEGVQLRAGRHIIVVPPSAGRSWEMSPSEAALVPLPTWIGQLVQEIEPNGSAYLPLPGRVTTGFRHPSYVSGARSMARAGFPKEAIVAALVVTDRLFGSPPKDDVGELERLVDWAIKIQAQAEATS